MQYVDNLQSAFSATEPASSSITTYINRKTILDNFSYHSTANV